MAKRHLGLGKAAKAKAKKQKTDTPETQTPETTAEPESAQTSNELTVELNEEIDPNDDMGQLAALWKTYATGDKENELVVNGIIHECDRMLRNSSEDSDKQLPDRFHSIYALALASLAIYNAEENDKVREFYDAALERIDLGLKHFPDSTGLLFSQSRILIDRIPLQYISQLTLDSKKGKQDIKKLLDDALKVYEAAEASAIAHKQWHFFNEENSETLTALDDLLDMIDNFGKDIMEGEESDDESDEDHEVSQLSPHHPLTAIRESDDYNVWWRKHTESFLDNLNIQLKQNDTADLQKLRRVISSRLGQSLLLEAETPINVYTTLVYDDSFEGKELAGFTVEEAQKLSQRLIGEALVYLRDARDKEEPDTWVNVAEALISLGNVHELDSAEQEKCYKEAEGILTKANNATNGKYEDILENLLS